MHASVELATPENGVLSIFFYARAVALIVGGPTHAHCTPVVRLLHPSDRPSAGITRWTAPPDSHDGGREISVPGMCDPLLDLFRIKIAAGDHAFVYRNGYYCIDFQVCAVQVAGRGGFLLTLKGHKAQHDCCLLLYYPPS